MSKKIVISSIGVGIVFVFFTLFLFIPSKDNKNEVKPVRIPNSKPSNISIAVLPQSFTSYSIFVAKEKKIFQKHGINVELKTGYNSGKETIDSMLKGQADFAVSSETPFMHAVLRKDDVCLITVMITAYNHLGIVARKDAGIQLPPDLSGKRIGITKSSNAEYFFSMAARYYNINQDSLSIVNLPPAELPDAIVQGKVDAIAAWNPIKINALKKLGKNAVQFYPKDVYSPHFILVTSRKNSIEYQDSITGLLAALNETSQFIQKNLQESCKIVSPYLKTDADTLNSIISSYDFQLQLDQDILHSLENQAMWIFARKNKKCVLPNFLDYISTEALYKTAPDKVKLIVPKK